MTKKKGHGKNYTSYPHRRRRSYGRKPNNAKKGSPRFYNKPPEGGDYRSRVISQMKYVYRSSGDLNQMGDRSGEHFPPYGQGGEKLP